MVMRKYFGLFYWCVMVLLVSLILRSAMGSFGSALFLSLMLLPGVLLVKYLSKDISYKNRKQGVLHTLYLVAIASLTEYLAIIFVHWNLHGFESFQKLEMVLNPFFIWFVLASLLSIEALIKSHFMGDVPPEKYIRFTSERAKVALELDSITYVESRDYAVYVMTASGKSYPTRMKISQWELALDDRFVRVHRSFIVNRRYVTRIDSRAVYLGDDLPIEISRKYKESVQEKLGD